MVSWTLISTSEYAELSHTSLWSNSFAYFCSYYLTEEVEEEDYAKQLISLGGLKWRKGRALSESPRFVAKAPKIVNVKVSPRTIQQPR